MKIKQNPDCPNKENNAIFERIHQDIYIDYSMFYPNR